MPEICVAAWNANRLATTNNVEENQKQLRRLERTIEINSGIAADIFGIEINLHWIFLEELEIYVVQFTKESPNIRIYVVGLKRSRFFYNDIYNILYCFGEESTRITSANPTSSLFGLDVQYILRNLFNSIESSPLNTISLSSKSTILVQPDLDFRFRSTVNTKASLNHLERYCCR